MTLRLPQQEDEAGRKVRDEELRLRGQQYAPWRPVEAEDGIVRPLDLQLRTSWGRPVLPAHERFWQTAGAGMRIGLSLMHISAATRLTVRRAQGRSSHDLAQRYLSMFDARERTALPLGGYAYEDEGFGLQRLYGSSPYRIASVKALPPHVGVREEHVANVVPEGATLEGLMRCGALYISDTAEAFEGQLGHPALYKANVRAATTSLFYLDEGRQRLMPCAIQLLPEPVRGRANPVLTPASASGAWLAAKLFANQSEAVAHVAGLHTAGTWAVGQAVVAMRRCLSERHPIHAFSYPWTRDFVAMTAMLQMGSFPVPPWKPLDGPLGGQYWRRFCLDDLHLPRRIEARGMNRLEVFPWRDNMLAVWRTIERFAEGVVRLAYASDAAVVGDPEIQRWAQTLHSPTRCHMRSRSLEESGGRMVSREQLVDILTTILFFLSAWHGYDAFNWPWFAWVPSTPLSFALPLPQSATEDIPLQTIIDALPAPSSSEAIMHKSGIMAVRRQWQHSRLTSGGVDGHFVPEVPGYLEGLEEAQPLVRAFFAGLAQLETDFGERDDVLRRRGHLPAPAATYPSNCAGTVWAG